MLLSNAPARSIVARRFGPTEDLASARDMSAALPANPQAVSAQDRTCRASAITGCWGAAAALAGLAVRLLVVFRGLCCVDFIAASSGCAGRWLSPCWPGFRGILNAAAGKRKQHHDALRGASRLRRDQPSG